METRKPCFVCAACFTCRFYYDGRTHKFTTDKTPCLDCKENTGHCNECVFSVSEFYNGLEVRTCDL